MVAYPLQDMRGTHGISEQDGILRQSPGLFQNVSSFLADKSSHLLVLGLPRYFSLRTTTSKSPTN